MRSPRRTHEHRYDDIQRSARLLADDDDVPDCPLGLIGVVAVLLLFLASLGFVVILGIITLSGMIMRNSVIPVDQTGTEMEAGLNLWNTVLEAAGGRGRWC